ncbi:MAG: AarF/ABC1/UbiB kinase family protein, partial [Firmicutes bacterium]|nr:AarF/ABC1/UbiB kinase family protein [Bacillota bacterium]
EIEKFKNRDNKRSAEIIGIFAAHNYYANGFTPAEMRTTLEALGPTYVKIGQIMSSRTDLLPIEYCEELEKLRQNVQPLDPKLARAVIEQETGRPIEDIYSEFRDKPLGSASIGQAHYGVLKDGTRVVTKVQRPYIAETMAQDFVMLKKLAGVVNVLSDSDGDQAVDLLTVIEELEKVTNEELDFRVEAANTKEFKEKCIDDEEKVTCPDVIDELTTQRIFTMTYVDGYSIAKHSKLVEDGYDLLALGTDLIDNYVHQILDVGLFHADPHQGNIMVSGGRPYWIDFGMIGRIDNRDIDSLQSIVMSLLKADAEEMVSVIMSMGKTSPKTDRNKLLLDTEIMLDKYANVTGVNDLDVSVLLTEVMDLGNKHHVTLPGKFTMLMRSIITIEGVIEQLCPELNLFELLSNKLMDRMKKNFDLKQELIDKGKDFLTAGAKTAKIPLLAADALNNLAKGRLKINMELAGYEEPLEKIGDFIVYIILAVFACVLFIGSCILCTTDIRPVTTQGIPLIAAVGFVFSVSFGIFAVKKMWKR